MTTTKMAQNPSSETLIRLKHAVALSFRYWLLDSSSSFQWIPLVAISDDAIGMPRWYLGPRNGNHPTILWRWSTLKKETFSQGQPFSKYCLLDGALYAGIYGNLPSTLRWVLLRAWSLSERKDNLTLKTLELLECSNTLKGHIRGDRYTGTWYTIW